MPLYLLIPLILLGVLASVWLAGKVATGLAQLVLWLVCMLMGVACIGLTVFFRAGVLFKNIPHHGSDLPQMAFVGIPLVGMIAFVGAWLVSKSLLLRALILLPAAFCLWLLYQQSGRLLHG